MLQVPHLQKRGVEHELASLVALGSDVDSLAVRQLVLCEGDLSACAARSAHRVTACACLHPSEARMETYSTNRVFCEEASHVVHRRIINNTQQGRTPHHLFKKQLCRVPSSSQNAIACTRANSHNPRTCTCMPIWFVYECIYIYIYTYTHTQNTYTHTHTHTYTHTRKRRITQRSAGVHLSSKSSSDVLHVVSLRSLMICCTRFK
jgi:hypothetical protein